MYATQKYSAEDRVKTSQEWAHEYPDRIPIIVSSSHWAFYKFRCMLVPQDMTIQELCTTMYHNWRTTFPKDTSHLYLKVAQGSSDSEIVTHSLTPTWTVHQVAQSSLSPDGFLYLVAHKLE